MRKLGTFALMISAFLAATSPSMAQSQTNAADANPPAAGPAVDIVPPVIPLQPNLPGGVQPGMPGIPNTTAATQALGQGGLPSSNIPGANSPYAAPTALTPNSLTPNSTCTTPGGGGAVYGSQYGENLGGGPGSTNAQASAVLGTGC